VKDELPSGHKFISPCSSAQDKAVIHVELFPCQVEIFL